MIRIPSVIVGTRFYSVSETRRASLDELLNEPETRLLGCGLFTGIESGQQNVGDSNDNSRRTINGDEPDTLVSKFFFFDRDLM